MYTVIWIDTYVYVGAVLTEGQRSMSGVFLNHSLNEVGAHQFPRPPSVSTTITAAAELQPGTTTTAAAELQPGTTTTTTAAELQPGTTTTTTGFYVDAGDLNSEPHTADALPTEPSPNQVPIHIRM